MHQHGILKSDDMIARFFRVCTEMCVDLCYRALNDQVCNQHLVRVRCFHTLDAYVLLIVLLVKHSGDGQPTTKITLLNKIVTILAGVLAQDHKVRREEFHQLPFHRIFITLFIELTANDPLLEPIHMEILTVFWYKNYLCDHLNFNQIFHAIQPRYYPGFTFAWLDIIGHRTFIGRVLVNTANNKAWSMYIQLLTDHLRFLAPFLRNIEFQKSIAMVYAGTLRILLVILHDIPELLCEYHYALCDVIPANCIQLRNLILSAYPRNMRLPDPFMPNLKVDQLAEINQLPRISVNYVQAIQPASLKNDLDNYLKNRAPVSFLSDLRSKLQISNEPGQKYNLALMNAVILYVGAQAIQAIQAKDQRPSISTIAHTAHMDIFQNFAVDLDTEGRYLFFNAVANQLRYPNSHTHYFSCTLLYLFAESNSEAIQEQITRILFERLVALRPHPWGLLITFIELIKNPYYKFWSHEFVRCAPEIENLFESIARSCMVKHNASESP
uniref:CCR4-Not complex component Not1 C-terminal domain-containing protein n=1 Tax=Romanomermis culicivorax TaxID=13658 RepID=A0A915KV50_ROMCU